MRLGEWGVLRSLACAKGLLNGGFLNLMGVNSKDECMIEKDILEMMRRYDLKQTLFVYRMNKGMSLSVDFQA